MNAHFSRHLLTVVAVLAGLVGLAPSAHATDNAALAQHPTCDIQRDQGVWTAHIQAAVFTTQPQMMVVDGQPFTATPDRDGIVNWRVPAKSPMFGVRGMPVNCTVDHVAIAPVILPPDPRPVSQAQGYRLHPFELQVRPVVWRAKSTLLASVP